MPGNQCSQLSLLLTVLLVLFITTCISVSVVSGQSTGEWWKFRILRGSMQDLHLLAVLCHNISVPRAMWRDYTQQLIAMF